jgi:hypothetical protein
MESVSTVQAHFANLTNVIGKMNRTNGFAVEVSDILVGGSGSSHIQKGHGAN